MFTSNVISCAGLVWNSSTLHMRIKRWTNCVKKFNKLLFVYIGRTHQNLHKKSIMNNHNIENKIKKKIQLNEKF